MRRGGLGLIVGCLVFALAAGRADAQAPTDEEARIHYQAGASYFERGEYDSALREFEASYALSHRPQLLYNLSLCHQQAGDVDGAIRYLEQYLAEVGDLDNRAALEARLANLRARAERASDARGAELPQESAQESAREGDTTNVPAIVGFVVAGVGLLAGGVFSGLTLAEDARVGALACAGDRSCSSSDVSALNTLALVADVSWGVSLAGAVIGTIFLFVPTGSPTGDAHAGLRWAPLVGTATGLALEGSF